MVRTYEGPPESRTDIITDILMQITELYPTEYDRLEPIIKKLLVKEPLSDCEKSIVRGWLREFADNPDR